MDYPFDLGTWSRAITTASPQAQIWFDWGLNWTYAYNHEEAVACFERALSHDPDCAMAWWGIAYAGGPFYNRPWIRYTQAEISETLPRCHHAAERAAQVANGCSVAEIALIDAIALRYQAPNQTDTDVLNAWHRDFTGEMRKAHAAHSDDLDIAALFAEAAVTCTPRQLWDLQTGAAKSTALTTEALDVLDTSLAKMHAAGLAHPGLLHMHIHTLEMSPFPEKALAAADQLRGLMPDAGHLEHMPAHIYVLCGDYAQSVRQSDLAVAADDKYVDFAGDANFYTTARCHDLHLYIYAAMFLGDRTAALGAAESIRAFATPELVGTSPPFMASILDGYSGMLTHVMVRFGMWQDLAATPPPEQLDLFPIRTAMSAYGRGVAHAALGQIDEALAAQAEYRAAQLAFSAEAIFLSNPIRDILAIGDAMLEGEIAYRRKDFNAAFRALRLAVTRDDALNYTEPWAWMHPPRHALGALLAAQGQSAEAIEVFRQDLGLSGGLPRCCQHPGNIWALTGLANVLKTAGRREETAALQAELSTARAAAELPIESACFCSLTKL